MSILAFQPEAGGIACVCVSVCVSMCMSKGVLGRAETSYIIFEGCLTERTCEREREGG